eukprot:547273_1
MSTNLGDEFIESQLLDDTLHNLLTTNENGNFQRIIHLLRTPSIECKANKKRNFKMLSTTNQITKSDGKQYCITKLLTFEYLDFLLLSTQQNINKESSKLILSILINESPIIFMKKIIKYNYLFHENHKISLLCLIIINTFLEKQCQLNPNNSNIKTPKQIENTKLNAFIHHWLIMDFFKCILIILSLYSYPSNPIFTLHIQIITQIFNNTLLFCSNKQLNTLQTYNTGYFYIENRNLCITQEHKEEKKQEIQLSKDIDLLSLNKLYLYNNESSETCNILIVGDGDFTFSNALVSLWPYIASCNNNNNNKCVVLNLITSTFHDVTSLIKKYHNCDIANTIYKIQTSNINTKVLYGIDATNLKCFNSNNYLFDRIIFNFPQTETSVGDHRLKSMNQNLIFKFLQTCEGILSKNGCIFIALHINEFKANVLRNTRKDDEIIKNNKNGPRYVEIKPMEMYENKEMKMNVSHDQFFTWNISDVLKRKELKWLKLNRSVPFHVQWYPGYNVTNVKGQLFDFCKAKIHIFKRILK